MNHRLVALSVLILGLACVDFSQQLPPGGDFTSWTKKDTSRILVNSPWSKTIEWRSQPVDTRQVGTIVSPLAPAKIMLRSAPPVRQAMLRSRQIDAKYDTMSAADKQAFDSKNRALIDCPACASYYVVLVASRYLSMENHTYLGDRKEFVYLSNEAGEKREMVEFSIPPGNVNEILFYFPRADGNGVPLLSASNKKLTFNFELKGLDGKSTFPFEKFDFKVADLVKDGVVLF